MKTQTLTNAELKDQQKVDHSRFAREFRKTKQDWTIDSWCNKLGITRRGLETHPNVKDIRTLLDFDAYDHLMTEKDRDIWKHAWRWVYEKQLPIGAHIEKRLLSIVENCKYREQRCQQQREARKLQRQQKWSHTQNGHDKGDHNDEAKGSQSAEELLSTVQQHMDDGSRKG